MITRSHAQLKGDENHRRPAKLSDQVSDAISQHYFWQVLSLLQVSTSYHLRGVWKKVRH